MYNALVSIFNKKGMKFMKKIIASLLATATLLSFTSCGTDTSWVYKTEDVTITSGMYVGLSLSAYESAKAVEGFDATKTPYKQEIEGKNGLQWVKDEVESAVYRYIAIERKFAEMGLPFDTATENYLNSMSEAYYTQYDQAYNYADNGFGLESYKKIQTNQYKNNAIFESLYDEGGSEAVPVDDLTSYFYENYGKVFYVPVSTKEIDEEGETVDRNKEDIDADIADITARLEKGEDFQTILDDYFKELEEKPEASNYTVILDKKEIGNTPQGIFDLITKEKVGAVTAVESGTSYLVAKNLDIKEDRNDFDNYRSTVLSKVKGDEYNDRIETWAEEIELEVNNASLRKHNPKNLKINK